MAHSPAGELGNVSLSYRSTGKVLTLVFTTDGDGTRGGFNATYTKFYAGTNLTGVGMQHAATSCGVLMLEHNIMTSLRSTTGLWPL